MAFDSNASTTATNEMNAINPDLSYKFVSIVNFLMYSPQSAPNFRGGAAPEIGSEAYIKKLAVAFSNSRLSRSPNPPETVPDKMVSVILNEYFGVDGSQLSRISEEHLLSMGAENFVGELLERYLASVLENMGWVWCSGSVVKAADFIKATGSQWHVLQVKNRDNSENSSSSAIRNGTDIKKWFRTFSRKVGSNWEAFPDDAARGFLSEANFIAFTKNYLLGLKSKR